MSPKKHGEYYLEAVRDLMAKLYAYGEAKPPEMPQFARPLLVTKNGYARGKHEQEAVSYRHSLGKMFQGILGMPYQDHPSNARFMATMPNSWVYYDNVNMH